MRGRRAPVLVALVMAGCGATVMPEPSARPIATVEIDAAPAAFLNGAPGLATQWCPDACRQLPSPPHVRTLPVVVNPELVAVPDGAILDTVTAWGPGLVGADPSSYFNVPFRGARLLDVPDGAVSIEIRVMWPEGGTAAYLWHVAPG